MFPLVVVVDRRTSSSAIDSDRLLRQELAAVWGKGGRSDLSKKRRRARQEDEAN